MDPQRFTMLNGMLDDNRKLIAAAKVSRWDALKWGVALNLLTAGASVTLRAPAFILYLLIVLITAATVFLVLHYNKRAWKTREDSAGIKADLVDIADLDSYRGRSGYPHTHWLYDKEELQIFAVVLFGSAAYACCAVFFRSFS
jgi:hypothetical protein